MVGIGGEPDRVVGLGAHVACATLALSVAQLEPKQLQPAVNPVQLVLVHV